MFPTGVPLFVRLKRLVVYIENPTVYGRWIGGFGCGAWGALALVVCGGPGGVLGSIALPNLNIFSTPMFTEMNADPRPKFRGIIC